MARGDRRDLDTVDRLRCVDEGRRQRQRGNTSTPAQRHVGEEPSAGARTIVLSRFHLAPCNLGPKLLDLVLAVPDRLLRHVAPPRAQARPNLPFVGLGFDHEGGLSLTAAVPGNESCRRDRVNGCTSCNC
jgi:hypothetical protein